MNAPILVTGCARSGTSMVAGTIHLCGAFGGEMSGPNRNNRKGMFENRCIRNHILKPCLAELGADPMGQSPLPDPQLVHTRATRDGLRFFSRVLRVMASQGYRDGPWFYKGAKLCLVWEIVHSAFPEAQWVIVRRPTADIVASCMRTSFMSAFKSPQGWGGWVDDHLRRFDAMKKRVRWTEVWADRLVNEGVPYATQYLELIGLACDDQAVKNFISPPLLHQGPGGLGER